MGMADYKEEHQSFVTGHNGTSYQEVAMVASISCIACLSRDLFLLSSFTSAIRPSLMTDFFLLVLPNIIGVTLLSNCIGIFHFAILLACVLGCLHHVYQKRTVRISPVLCQTNLSERKAFITYFKSVINICTAVAILAVDFPVFPRRLSKSEVYGFGGMDAGVGFFVVANAIVSHEARGKYKFMPLIHQMKKTIISCLPVVILGFARLLAVKGVDYHEHVTEYGVHWNFFFTLVALKISLTLVFSVLPVNKSAHAAVGLLVIHQCLLSTGLSSYIVNGLDGAGGRTGIIDANREGIFSLPGYIAIYMIGVHLGGLIFKPRHNLQEWFGLVKQLTLAYLVFVMLMTTFHVAVEPVSRRFANAAFVFFTLSLSCLMLLECLVADIVITFIKALPQEKGQRHSDDRDNIVPRSKNTKLQATDGGFDESHTALKQMSASAKSVCLMDAVGYNSLLFFLLANLLTGIVNMSIATIHSNTAVAIGILVVYMFTVSAIIVSLRRRNISTKIW